MIFEDNCTEAELLNGDMVDCYFAFNYTPGYKAKYSGTSRAVDPDQSEEYDIFNIKIETITGDLVYLSDENESYVMGVLKEEAKNIYENWAEGMRESNYEDKQDLMNIAGRLN